MGRLLIGGAFCESYSLRGRQYMMEQQSDEGGVRDSRSSALSTSHIFVSCDQLEQKSEIDDEYEIASGGLTLQPLLFVGARSLYGRRVQQKAGGGAKAGNHALMGGLQGAAQDGELK